MDKEYWKGGGSERTQLFIVQIFMRSISGTEGLTNFNNVQYSRLP